jgi:hypothetical protein
VRKSILLFIAILLFSLPTAVEAQNRTETVLLKLWYPNDNPYLRLEAVVEGRKLVLASESIAFSDATPISMKTGDYKARIVKEASINAAQYSRSYELLLSDGKKLRFYVIGESKN